MAEHVDVAIIGTGVAAQTVAYPVQAAGRKVAIVDWRPYGGTCELRGCDPKRVLVGVETALASARRLEGHGIIAPGAHMNWHDLMRFKRSFTDGVSNSVHASLAGSGIRTFTGHARFTSGNSLAISGEDNVELEAEQIVIAAGAEPVPLRMQGSNLVITSEQFLNLEDLPERIVFIGGGYISFEFAHLAAEAGAHVTILHHSGRALKAFDSTLVDSLIASSREHDIDIRLNTSTTSIEQTGASLALHTSTADGEDTQLEADLVVHGAGRALDLQPLALERGGIAYSRGGITVDETLRSTTNPAVFAAGDAADTPAPRLTPVARMQGNILARNLLEGARESPDYAGIPTVVYTDPPLAAVGLTEEQAIAKSLAYDVHAADTSSWYSSRRLALTHTGYKVLTERGSGRILGAHLLGNHAEEVINLFALAIRARLPASLLQSLPWSYPTASSDLTYLL